MRFLWLRVLLLLHVGSAVAAWAAPTDYFAIHVIDDATGRGVPLVKLTTVNQIVCWTDSNGLVAFNEPGLMQQDVFFHVSSDGYEYPKDMFDNRGLKLRPVPGGEAVVKLRRLNIAERLYRITGAGIYRDTVLLGRISPLRQPVLNGRVFGQDTVIATPYRGKIYWFWGDTDKPSYPLGNFSASGATSELPSHGGLDPNVGVDLTYFVDDSGFSKAMCPDFGPGLQWIESLMTLPDEHGQERLIARVVSAAGLGGANAWHLAVFNDEKQIFESRVRWDIHDTHDVTTPFRARVGSDEYIYLYPDYRVKADLGSLSDLKSYQAFTCLAPGARYEGRASKLDRTRDGRIRYMWRASADRLNGPRLHELVSAGLLKPEESGRQLYNIENGRAIQSSRGSVCWNEYRRRWVMITGGMPGELWFAEADTPVGPWIYARRIVSHEAYNFYNPTQHPFFDAERGRIVFFEGTYTDSFSGAKEKTPRYNYNQIMYRLQLDDLRLALPAPVYSVRTGEGSSQLMMRDEIEAEHAWPNIESIAFLAIASSPLPSTAPADMITMYAVVENGITRLERMPSAGAKDARPLFLAFSTPRPPSPASAGRENYSSSERQLLAPLYEYRSRETGRRSYSASSSTETDAAMGTRSAEPLCWVWRTPKPVPILDPVVPLP